MRGLESILTLRTEMANDVSALCRIKERLKVSAQGLRALSPSDPVVAATAFELHNYYCVFENLMRRIATTFENALDPGEWHKQLMARMSLDIDGIRPALLDPPLRDRLDELRKFRHFFRNVYDRQLNPGKIADMLEILMAADGILLARIRRFLDWLDDLGKRLAESQS
jgi:hypothetical protein